MQLLTWYSSTCRLIHHNLMMLMWIHELSFSSNLTRATTTIFVHLLNDSLFVSLLLHCRNSWILWFLWFMILQRLMLEIGIATTDLSINTSTTLSIQWSRTRHISYLFGRYRWKMRRFSFIIVDCGPVSSTYLTQP